MLAEEAVHHHQRPVQGRLGTEAVLLALEPFIGHRDAAGLEGGDDHVRLLRGHDPVLQPLEDGQGAGESLEAVDR